MEKSSFLTKFFKITRALGNQEATLLFHSPSILAIGAIGTFQLQPSLQTTTNTKGTYLSHTLKLRATFIDSLGNNDHDRFLAYRQWPIVNGLSSMVYHQWPIVIKLIIEILIMIGHKAIMFVT